MKKILSHGTGDGYMKKALPHAPGVMKAFPHVSEEAASSQINHVIGDMQMLLCVPEEQIH